MNNQIIRFEVQMTPQIYQGAMQHYWRVFRIDSQGNNLTLHDGWNRSSLLGTDAALRAASKYAK